MPDQANVKSFDAIESVRGALLRFLQQVNEGRTELELEMRRTLEWLEHDRPRFWKEQVRVSHDGVHEAKVNLHRCLMYPRGVNDRPSCTEERAALKKAEARHAYCQDKQECLRHWIREIRTELHDYQGRVTQLVELIESDGPAAVGALDRLLRSLENYSQGGGSQYSSDVSGTISDDLNEEKTDDSVSGSDEA